MQTTKKLGVLPNANQRCKILLYGNAIGNKREMIMKLNPPASLIVDWYVVGRDHEPIANAIKASQGDHLRTTAKEVLADRRRQLRHTKKKTKATTWQDLATVCFGISMTTTENWRNGTSSPSIINLFALARELEVSVRELLPFDTDWLAGATRRLLDDGIDDKSCRIYAQFKLGVPIPKFVEFEMSELVDDETIRSRVILPLEIDDSTKDVVDTIFEVAHLLDPVIHKPHLIKQKYRETARRMRGPEQEI